MTWGTPLGKAPPRVERVWRDSEEPIREWAAFLERKGAALNTYEHYLSDVRAFARLWPNTLITKLEPDDIEASIDKFAMKCSKLQLRTPPVCMRGHDIAGCPLLQSTPTPYASCPSYRPLDPAGVRSYLRSLTAFYKWLVIEQHIKFNPVLGPRAIYEGKHKALFERRKREPRVRELELDEVRKIILGSPVQHAMGYMIEAKTFVREHELHKIDMHPKFFNLDEGWADLPYIREKGNKRQGNHCIIFDEELKRFMKKKYLPWWNAKVKRDKKKQPVTTMLLITDRGLPWGKGWQGNYNKALHKNAIRNGLMTGEETEREDRFNTHCFRSWCTEWARDKGASELDQKILRGDLLPGSLEEYARYRKKLPGLYAKYAPVLDI